MTRHDGLHN